ncbi:MAG: hypothetical protein HY719_13600 [Planctomycetes bacterium]|nr:hypothetical protein [Planctomycetota bacterium]
MATPGTTKGMSLDDFIARKLHPVKVTIHHLAQILDLHDGDSVPMTRSQLYSVISTLEIFVEEYERVSTVKPSASLSPKRDMVQTAMKKLA